jgi:hypothetical protein
MFKSEDLVCDVLAKHPQTWDVFERHGICEDCKQSPPPVPIMHFVEKHCDGKLDEFLQELNTAVI